MQTETTTRACYRSAARRGLAAFTILELLVVIAIIAVLATIGLPALKGFGQGNSIAGANRQLLDDLPEARLRAVNSHSTVYVVFVGPVLSRDGWNGGEGGRKKTVTDSHHS